MCAAGLFVGSPLAGARAERSLFPRARAAAAQFGARADAIGGPCDISVHCWEADARAFDGQNGVHAVYVCPSHGNSYSGIFGVWGTDVYSDNSSVCTAAVHAGKITPTDGGIVTIEIRPGEAVYQGSTRNGITSGGAGSRTNSFVFFDATPGTPPSAGVGLSGWNASATDFRTFSGERFVYVCPAAGTAGPVFGTTVYADDSSVCTAAVHAGAITLAGGGNVTIEMRAGQSAYTGSSQNGITSTSRGASSGSYVVLGAPAVTGPPSGTPSGTVLVNGAPFSGGQIAYNSTVDVTNGSLSLTTETGQVTLTGAGGVPAAFVLLRGVDNGKAIVEFRLSGGNFGVCKRKLASRAATAKTIRLLWGKGKGRFRTRGRYASATVRGTYWLTADRCDGTLTQVREGRVQVRDLVARKTILVPAGKSYLAKKR